VNGVGGGIAGLSNALKGWQSGYVRNYALSMLIGVVVVVVACLGISLRALAR
jgi:NADH-quinone oxidoreductase subunit L